MENKLPNIDLGKTQITDNVRVSSAAIYYDEWFGERYQLETFIFSNDKRIRTTQIIHKSIMPSYLDNYKDEITKIHNYISDNVKRKLCIS